MDNLGDILYVLFIVVALVASVMKKRKKQEAVPPFPSEDVNDTGLPEDLKEIFQRKRQTATHFPKPHIDRKREIIKKEPEKKFKTGLVSSLTIKKPNEIFEQELNDTRTDLEEIDWQKAVITSEILNRPQHFPG